MIPHKMLFVDDRSKRIHAALRQYDGFYDVTIAPNVPECLRLLSKGPWDVISLDYDLNGFDFCEPFDKNCGMEIVRYVCQLNKEEFKPRFIVHSSNLLGADIMYTRLKIEGFSVTKEVFQYFDEAK